jgi:hypothetical protein
MHFFLQFLEHKQHKQTSYRYIYIIYIDIYIIYIYTYKYIHFVSIRISSHRAAGLYTEISWARLVGMDQRWQLLAHLDRLEKVTTTVCVDVVD